MTFESLLRKKKVYFIMLVLSLWLGCVPSPSFSLPVGSSGQSPDYSRDREAIDLFLAQEFVVKKLMSMGLSREQIDERLNRMSDDQIRNLAAQVEKIKAGGSGWALAIVLVLLFTGLVFFFTTHSVRVEPKRDARPK